MKKTTLIIALLLCGLISAQAQTGEKNFLDRPYIEVTGSAEMEIVPDEIYMNIVINEKDNKQKTTLAQAEKEMISKLNGLGIDIKKQLSVKDISSNFKNYWIKSSDILTSKEYQLLVYDAKTAGQVILSLEKAGISNVTIDRVDHSKIEQYRREVKVSAVKAAKEKAEDMAKAIGQTAGKALYINEIDYGNSNILRARNVAIMVSAKSESMDAASVPDIEFEKIQLEYKVSAKFELN